MVKKNNPGTKKKNREIGGSDGVSVKPTVDLGGVRPVERKKIDTSRGKVLYREWGASSAYPIVCLSGWPVSSLQYAPFAHVVSDDYRIIALDFPGWAGTETGGWDLNDIEDYAAYVENAIETLDLKAFSLLGHSYGGIISQIIIKRGNISPDHVFLVSTFHTWKRFSKCIYFRPGMEAYKLALALGASDKFIFRVLETSYMSFFKTKPYYKDVAEVPIFREIMKESMSGDVKILLDAGLAIRKRDILEEEPSAGKPKLRKVHVLWGTKDFGFIKKDSEEIAAYFGADTEVFEGADHFHVPVHPELTAEFIKKSLS
jgi:pimeloyl-ACP methyl ester carboxylesterase